MRRARAPLKSGKKGVFPSHPAKGEEGRARTAAATEAAREQRVRVVTKAVQAQRELFIEELVIVNTSAQRIIELARRPTGPIDTDRDSPRRGLLLLDGRPPGLGVGAGVARRLIGTVIENLARQSETNRVTNKPNAEARLYRHIRDAKRLGKWSAVQGFERLLSDVQGTRAPIKVDVNVTLQTALINVLGNMSPEQVDGLVAEYDELETKAQDGSSVLVQTPKAKVVGRIYEVQGTAGEYMVTVDDQGERCTCPDFVHRGHERPCKHVLLVKGELPQTGLRRRAP